MEHNQSGICNKSEKNCIKDEEVEYEVESILAYVSEPNGTKYKVKWKNHSILDTSWEPVENLVGASEQVILYWKQTIQQCGGNLDHLKNSIFLERNIPPDQVPMERSLISAPFSIPYHSVQVSNMELSKRLEGQLRIATETGCRDESRRYSTEWNQTNLDRRISNAMRSPGNQSHTGTSVVAHKPVLPTKNVTTSLSKARFFFYQ